MYLKHINVKKFRTYNDLQVLEEFSPSINLILGRNGSGKSNVIAAIAYVLTDYFSHMKEENKKFLFHKESRDLIEGGGAEDNKKEMSKLTVELYFSNSNKNLIINKDVVCVAKTYSILTNTEEYLINGKQVSKSDIYKIFGNYCLKEPFYIVQQGQISRMVNSSGEDLFNLCSEVFGVKELEKSLSIWEVEILDIKDNISKLKENYHTIENLLTTFQKQCDDLESFENKEKYKKAYEYIIFQEKSKQESNSLSIFKDEKDQKLKLYNEILQKTNKLGEELSISVNKKHKIETKIEFIEAAIKKCDNEILLLNKTKSIINKQGIYKDDINKEDLATKEKLNQNKSSLLKQLETVQKEAKESNNNIFKLTLKLQDINKKIEDLHNNAKGIVSYEKFIINTILSNNLLDNSKKTLSLKEELSKLENIRNNENNSNVKINEEILIADKNLNRLKNEIQTKKNEISTLSEDDITITRKINRFKEERVLLANELKKNYLENNEISSKIDLNKDKINSVRANMLYSDTYSSVCNILNQNIEGVYGCVLDYLNLDNSQYNKAIEQIGKQKLLSIICDSSEIAMKILNFNKEMKGGVIQIIPLDDPFNNKSKSINYPNDKYCAPLINLIELNSDTLNRYNIDASIIKPIINNIFYKSLLVKDFDTGMKYAKSHKLTCITADNQLINAGAITLKVSSSTQKEFISNYLDLKDVTIEIQAQTIRKSSLDQNISDILQKDDFLTKQVQENLLSKQQIHIKTNDNHKLINNLNTELELLESGLILKTNTNNNFNKKILTLNEKIEFLNKKLKENQNGKGFFLNFTSIAENERQDLESNLIELEKAKIEVMSEISKIESIINNSLLTKEQKIINDMEQLTKNLDMLKIDNNSLILNNINTEIVVDNQTKKENTQQKKGKRKTQNSQIAQKEDEATENLLILTLDSIDNINNDENQLKAAKQHYLIEKNAYSKDINSLTERISKIKLEIEKDKSVLDNKETEIKLLNKKIADCNVNLDSINTLFNSIKASMDSIEIEELIKKERKKATELVKNRKENTDEWRAKFLEPFYNKLKEFNNKLSKYSNVDRLAHDRFTQFKDKAKEFETLINDLENKEEAFNLFISELKKVQVEKFDEAFERLRVNMNYYFKIFAPNGSVNLIVNNKKTIKNEKKILEILVNFTQNEPMKIMRELSGGQKTATALALIFGLSNESKPPFFILDEVESALDTTAKLNFGKLVKELSKEHQFFITTFKQETVSITTEEDNLYFVNYANKSSFMTKINQSYAMEFLSLSDKTN